LPEVGVASNAVHVIQYGGGQGSAFHRKECGYSLHESNLSAIFNDANTGYANPR
jgi:hypothetical protein